MNSFPTPDPTSKETFPARLRHWLPRLRQDIEGGGGGVNISGGNTTITGDVIGGNKIINIGAVVVPVRFLVALLVVALLVAVGVWWIVTPGKMPAGNANVAIVEFGVKNADGTISNSAQGAYLSQWLYNRLSDSLADLPEDARPTFWHLATGFDLTHLFQKRSISAPIRSTQDLQKVAEDFNARIVIYGNLDGNQDPTTFTPQIYVAQTKGEADELTGSQQLGQPIPISKTVNDEYLQQNLQPIGRALVWFSRGLNYDLNGRYDIAYQVLKQGQAQLTDWDENQGKEVLYYFIGREALFLGNCESDAQLVFTPQGNTSAVALALNAAEDNFSKAQGIAMRNGRTYARATFGLGQVALQRAQRAILPPGSTTVGQCRINLPTGSGSTACPPSAAPNRDADALKEAHHQIELAIPLLDRAIQELPNPPQGDLDVKVKQVRATADTFLGLLQFLDNKAADAEPFLQSAITALQPLTASAPPEDRRELTNIYLSLGNAQFYSANAQLARGDAAASKMRVQDAINSFSACVKLIPTDEIDAFLRSLMLPNCTCRNADAQKMLEGLK